jgi:hypothetical protein
LQRLMRTSPVVEIEVAVQRLSQLMAVALYLICCTQFVDKNHCLHLAGKLDTPNTALIL